ncbi:ABC-type oligopeptide transport system substrate-binding subunit [Evansella vedderi]|uniref:ABC-type oligopeptide transport system substrate-binding subunit n=1 Tax=Evansella vedderi TaxID=38282 RepID=A0ABT9ZNX1_9BACI|nr:hypothetical protein [Evansella vedderi]MDQ0252936.1 ABC-type oligopeptide transport system substrate-binding subunit [Evansella vedderi]
MKKVSKLMFLCLSLVVFLMACSGGDTSSQATGGDSGEGSGEKQRLTVAQNSDAVTLDPHKTNDLASANPMQQIYNTLVDLTADMEVFLPLQSLGSRKMNLLGSLAFVMM